ncbi:TIR domain-containing protein [Pseudomonas aeruginosa]|uniref:TIR domain-containing protein n=1 Tax=Pseudomonas paraeruginosa TaxID=2994495 RepID=UPI002A2EB2B6|nr:TIR domain-containing protein [Pseudomonas aeruginosa]
MAYRNGNYTAFYVAEPFHPSSLGANATKDFQYYNTLRMWKGADATFPFVDSHDKTYSVRDGSDWEYTLKPRLRERLRNSKNIILILSSITTNSRALREEVDYGINNQGLPVIVVYPEYATKESLLAGGSLKQEVKGLWGNLPVFRDSMSKVPTLHVPMNKDLIKQALNNSNFMVSSKGNPDFYWYKA